MYYNPDHYGLKIQFQHDFSDGNYCFDYRVIWKELKTNRFFTARDSGCSCSIPFEYHRMKDLQVANFQELIEEARRKEQKDEYYRRDSVADYVEKLRYYKRTYA